MNSAFQSDSDSIPVKEFDTRSGAQSRESRPSRQSLHNPRIVRDELEDRYLSLSDENICLKKQLRHHEEREKQLATKLVRLVSEKGSSSSLDRRDTQFALEEQRDRIAELEEERKLLKDKLTAVMRRQPQGSFTKLVPTGPRKAARKPVPVVNKNSRTGFGGPSPSPNRAVVESNRAIAVHDHVTQLLFEAKGENHALRDQVKRLREELSMADKEIMACKEQLQVKELEREDELLAYRLQVESDVDLKKQKIAENMQLLRLQRDSRRTANWLSTYETQCHTLESSLSTANETIQQLEAKIEAIQAELHDEQTKKLNLMKQAEESSSVINQMKEVELQIQSLQDENRMLKEANDSLMSKALDSSNRTSSNKPDEKEDASLKLQVAELEQALKTEIAAKFELTSSVSAERTKCLSMQQEVDALNLKCSALSDQLKEAESKLITEGKRASVKGASSQNSPLHTGAAPACAKCLSLEIELNKSKLGTVQVRDELSHTKDLLEVQVRSNKEYQAEIDALKAKLEKADTFRQEKLQEFMKTLEQRAEQMLRVERYLESYTTTANNNKRAITPTTSTMTMTEEPVCSTCAAVVSPVKANSPHQQSSHS